MKALVLAAGFGTRLAPYTDHLPKALFPVGGTPLLGHMIAALKAAGCATIAVNTHHLEDRIRAYLAENDFGLPVHLSHEPEILGTGGAIRRLADFWDSDPFLVVNADIFTDINLAEVYRSHCGQSAPVTLVMHDYEDFNQVWVDRCGRVAGFERFGDSPPSDRHRKLAFTGIHVLDAGIVGRIPEGKFCNIISIYRELLAEGRTIHAHVVRHHYWQDVGTPERFRDAAMDALTPEVFRMAFPDSSLKAIRRRQLAGDGSDRKWYRLSDGGKSIIMADHGIAPDPQGSEARSFVSIGTHLYKCGLPVPRIYRYDAFSGLVFMEDLGDNHLQQAVRQETDDGLKKRCYRKVIDTLLDLSTEAADGFDPQWTCQTRAYDRNLILNKECRYFMSAFVNGYLDLAVGCEDLDEEFEILARRTLENGLTGLIHRDFQSRNIMIRDGRHYLIDFQGARIGPIQYDLASLLIDPYARLLPDLQQELLHYAVQQAKKRLNGDPDRFVSGYRHCVVTRNLQMLGAFGFLSRVKGKRMFERWIPAAGSMLAGHLHVAGNRDFPKLTALAETIRRELSRCRPRHTDR
jgi:aminoglycoside/choline kinase family phosphotransferase/dTDP-glucose pyrophosphorylase